MNSYNRPRNKSHQNIVINLIVSYKIKNMRSEPYPCYDGKPFLAELLLTGLAPGQTHKLTCRKEVPKNYLNLYIKLYQTSFEEFFLEIFSIGFYRKNFLLL